MIVVPAYLKIKVKYLSDIEHIEKISVGDWIDLRAAKDYTLKRDSTGRR